MAHGHSPAIEQAELPQDSVIRQVPRVAIGVAAVALVAGWFTRADTHEWAFSYLVAFLFVLSIGLGSLFFVLIQHAARAGWSVTVRRTAENLASVLPMLAVLFVPVFLTRHDLYHHWMGDHAHDDPILAGKAGYLNEPFWVERAVVFFAVWAGLSVLFRRSSIAQDLIGGTKITHRLERLSYVSIPVFAATLTFASFDWAMSLDPHWFSTMWGVYYFAGCVVGGFASILLTVLGLQATGSLKGWVTEEHLHDLGKLLFAFTVFWTYISFSQYFLIWYSNIPEETAWYHHRQGSWEVLGITLIVGHFVLPFLVMLSRWRKRNPRWLASFGVWMLVLHFLDICWMVLPAAPSGHHGLNLSVSGVLTALGLFALFVAAAASTLPRARLVATGDPRLPECLAHVNF